VVLTLEVPEPLRSVVPSLRHRFRAEGWWTDDTFASGGEMWAAQDPDATYLRDDRRALTRAEFTDSARRFASALGRRGLGRDCVVALQAANSVEYAVANIGCELVGATWVNMSLSYRRHEMVQILGDLRADALVGTTSYRGFDFRALVRQVQSEVPTLTTVVATDDCRTSGWERFGDLVGEDVDEEMIAAQRLRADDIYTIMLSSGTTSARPKEALRTVNSMLSALRAINEMLQVGPSDRIFCLAPQSGGTGYSYSVAFPMITGSLVDVTEQGLGPGLATRIAQSRPTVLVAVPTQMTRLLDEAASDRSIWSELRMIVNSGAPLLGDVAARAEEECGCPIVSVYGATDGLVPVMADPRAEAHVRHASVGRAMAGHRVRIIDDDSHEMPPGGAGEICGFGPGMAFGYVDNPSEMARAWDNEGWWHSGDLGVLDEDGYLRVVGRKKDMILRGGVNISPLEIEELLSQHPDVEEVVVVPIAHAKLVEQACAVIVTRSGRALSLSEVSNFLEQRGLAKFKFPERVEMRREIPRTPLQKIDRLRLRSELSPAGPGDATADGPARAQG
jgi:acyl-CoA synthetase (AMP-forming)/AMP-acid ligase II